MTDIHDMAEQISLEVLSDTSTDDAATQLKRYRNHEEKARDLGVSVNELLRPDTTRFQRLIDDILDNQ